MTRNKIDKTVTHQTFIMGIVLTFTLGFIAGIVFTAFKERSMPIGSFKGGSGEEHRPGASEAPEAMGRALEEEVAKHPENHDAWIQLGHFYFDHEKPQKAVDAYEKALALKPKNANVLTDLGVMYRRMDRPEKAVECFDQAVAADPSHETARFNKGIVLMHDLEDKAGALATWRELYRINPAFSTPGGQSLEQIIQHFDPQAKTEP